MCIQMQVDGLPLPFLSPTLPKFQGFLDALVKRVLVFPKCLAQFLKLPLNGLPEVLGSVLETSSAAGCGCNILNCTLYWTLSVRLTSRGRVYYYSYTYSYYIEKLSLSPWRGRLLNMRLLRLPAKADDTRNGTRNRNGVQNDHSYGCESGNDLSSNPHCTRTQNPKGCCMEKPRQRQDQAMAPLIHHRG